jgi:hypothetical protein
MSSVWQFILDKIKEFLIAAVSGSLEAIADNVSGNGGAALAGADGRTGRGHAGELERNDFRHGVKPE